MEENRSGKSSKNHAIILDGFLCSKSIPLSILPGIEQICIKRFCDDLIGACGVFELHLASAPQMWQSEKRRRVMCFRPAEISGPKECPSCGKIIPVIPGMPLPEKCSGCGADLSSLSTNATGSPSTPPSVPTPGAPKAPGAPKTPSAPKPPSAD